MMASFGFGTAPSWHSVGWVRDQHFPASSQALFSPHVVPQEAFVPAEQSPWLQDSLLVQGVFVLQAVPSSSGGLEHSPVRGSQTPRAWH